MEIKELLKDKQVAEPIKNFADELSYVYEGKTIHELLDKQTAEIGLILLDKHSGSTTKKDNWVIIPPVVKNDERYRKLYELIPETGWKTKELTNLLVYFFGEEKAEYVAHA